MTESTAVAVAEPTANTSVVMYMAEKYGMAPAAFEATLRATVCKGNVTREESLRKNALYMIDQRLLGK